MSMRFQVILRALSSFRAADIAIEDILSPLALQVGKLAEKQRESR
jgi:hypothetical protein